MAVGQGESTLRADTERTMRAVIAAAESVLARNPSASMEMIADEAGVARTTVHRRFSSRGVLIDAVVATALTRISEAIDDARPSTAPPSVALHEATVNMLRVKNHWRFAMRNLSPDNATAVAIEEELYAKCDVIFDRAQQDGLIHAEIDRRWVHRVYRALIDEINEYVADESGPGQGAVDLDATARLLIETFLCGLGGSAQR